MKVVINTGIGGFGLSEQVLEWFVVWVGKDLTYTELLALPRNDPDLIVAVEELGSDADGKHATLKVVEIPDGVEFFVREEDDGTEWIAEKHRTWS